MAYFVLRNYSVTDCIAVDTCVPGDMVTVSGIVKVTNSDEGK